MNMKTNSELLEEFQLTRNLKPESMKVYRAAVKLYTTFNQMTLAELLHEAEDEEYKRLLWKDRTLKERLIKFRAFLNQTYKKSYAIKSLSRILTIYDTFFIELGKLPDASNINYIEPAPLKFSDLLTKVIIKDAYELSDNLMQAILLFQASSGCAIQETINLTINQFIEATNEFHSNKDIISILAELKEQNNVVPIFELERQKTGKHYYTFCSPEAVTSIVNYLISERIEYDNNQPIPFKLNPDDKLFDINKVTLFKKYQKLNNQLQLGKKGTYNRMRSHMLRKFHASSLKNDGMDKYDVNSMQGKGLNSTDEAYFFEDPKKLREKYVEHLEAVLIVNDANVVNIKSPEVLQLEHENEMLRKQNLETNKRIDNLEKLVLGNISDDKLAKLDKLL